MITALQLQVLRQRVETAAVHYLGTHKNAFLKDVWVTPMLGTVKVRIRTKVGTPGSLFEINKSISVPWVTTREFGNACMEKITVDFLVKELGSAPMCRVAPAGQVKKIEKPEPVEDRKTNHFGALIKTVSRRTDDND